MNPVKGAAIFWYNLLRNGEGIIDTIHGACPVLIGEKWGNIHLFFLLLLILNILLFSFIYYKLVANFWIREHGQIFHRPCSLDPTK